MNMVFWPKLIKHQSIHLNNKNSLILLHFLYFFLIIQLILVTVRTPNKLYIRKNMGNQAELRKNINCFGAFIGALLVLGKKPCSLPAKL